jgi:predicted ATP-dependent protease
MIPEANVRHLMLREDVVEAVRDEAFHVYAVRTVDEGVEVLSRREAGQVNDAVALALIRNLEQLKAVRGASVPTAPPATTMRSL